MGIKILCFGELATIVGAEIVVEKTEDTVLMNDYLVEKYPALKNKTYRIAVNRQLVNERQDLKEGDEIALLPPFAGG